MKCPNCGFWVQMEVKRHALGNTSIIPLEKDIMRSGGHEE